MLKSLSLLALFFLTNIAIADVTIVRNLNSLTNAPPNLIGPELLNEMNKFNNPIISTSYIKNDKLLHKNHNESYYELYDLKAQKEYDVDPQTKKIVVHDIKFMQNNLGIAFEMPMKVQKTSNIKLINGFKCQEYAYSSNQQITSTGTVCVTKDVNWQAFGDFKSQYLNSPYEGLPIREETISNIFGAKLTMIEEIKSISYDPIPDSYFTLPSNYTIQNNLTNNGS